MTGPAAPGGSPGPVGRAVVLGPGGVAGTAWMAGLVSGLRRGGVDLGEAGLIVGTSAGAIVGAALATGQDLDRLAVLPRSADPGSAAHGPGPGWLTQVFTVLADPTLEPAVARRRAGRLALAAPTGTEHAHLAQMGLLITARQWPDCRLLITAVDADTGEPQIWDRASGAPLVSAVASSCAMPGIYPPITINGRRYIDGALRSGINADLADGARVLVIVNPLAHLFPARPPQHRAAVTIAPDPATVAIFGPDLHDRAAWQPAYQAGLRQAAQVGGRVRTTWRDQPGQ